MSHETWQLVKSFECLLSYAVLNIKDFAAYLVFKKLLKYILLRNQFYYNMNAIKYLLLFSLSTNNLIWYGRNHFELFQQLSCFVGHPVAYSDNVKKPDCGVRTCIPCNFSVITDGKA